MKIRVCILCFCVLSSPAWCEDALVIGTGGPGSPGYQLIKEIVPLWQTSRAKLKVTLTSSVQPDYERAQKELQANRLAFAVLPLKLVASTDLKVLALLWEVNLIPFGVSESPVEIGFGTAAIYIDKGDGIFRSLASEAFTSLDSTLFRHQLQSGVSGAYLKEAPGSFASLQRFAGQTLHPASLGFDLAEQLISTRPWLENRTFRFRQTYQTVGYTLVLAATKQVDMEQANELYLFLKTPPKSFWGKSRWLRSIRVQKTGTLDRGLLHPAIYYVKPH